MMGPQIEPAYGRLATIKEACRYGRWGLTKLYRLMGEGRITAVKDGRYTLIDLDSIDAYKRSLPPFRGTKKAGAP